MRLSMEPKRYQVFSWGEEFTNFDTATEVWNIISSWEVGRDVLRLSRVMLVTDRSWTVLLDVTIRQEQIGSDVEAATGDTSVADVVLGPNEGSSTGNVTGGRKLARYDFWPNAIKLQPPRLSRGARRADALAGWSANRRSPPNAAAAARRRRGRPC
jgi:hypothetical protein